MAQAAYVLYVTEDVDPVLGAARADSRPVVSPVAKHKRVR
jgi:hypothetical protein